MSSYCRQKLAMYNNFIGFVILLEPFMHLLCTFLILVRKRCMDVLIYAKSLVSQYELLPLYRTTIFSIRFQHDWVLKQWSIVDSDERQLYVSAFWLFIFEKGKIHFRQKKILTWNFGLQYLVLCGVYCLFQWLEKL